MSGICGREEAPQSENEAKREKVKMGIENKYNKSNSRKQKLIVVHFWIFLKRKMK